MLVMAGGAAAQTAAPAEPTSVTVTGKKKPVERKIDGTVYDESQNPKAASGTAADVLNTVPAVHVTANGDVTLRGNSNVQVYVDGKPAAQMQGDSRAVTLQAMSGSDIASVEVITNPSAKYDANGGGIINIVLKKNHKAGASGALIANAGNGARNNVNLSGNWSHGKLSLNGRAGFRHDLNDQVKSADVTWIDAGGQPAGRSVQHSATPSRRFSQSAQLGAAYALTPADDLNASLTWSQNQSHNLINEFHQDYDALGQLSDDYDRRSMGPRKQTNTAARLDYDHRGTKTGDELKLSLSHSETINDRDKSYLNLFSTPVQPDTAERLLNKDGRRLDEISLDYGRPFGEAAQLSLGADFQDEQDRYYNYQAAVDVPTGAETVNSLTTNRFVVDQSLDAAYVTVQAPVARWTVLTGLRLEQVNTDAHQITTGITHSHAYVNLNPSLHALYRIDEKRQWTVSYRQSLQRPDARDLNPFTVYVDAQNVTAGNPDLQPQRVASIEGGYAYTTDPFSDSITLYYRTSARTVTDYAYFTGNNVLLTTKRNSGTGRSGGVDVSVNGKPSESLSYSFDGNVFYSELRSADVGGLLKQSGLSYTAQATIDYSPGDDDDFELSGNVQGPSLTSQGRRSGTSSVDASWRHRLTPKLRLVVNANDLLNGSRETLTLRTSTVHSVAVTRSIGPSVFVGLSWLFGKK